MQHPSSLMRLTASLLVAASAVAAESDKPSAPMLEGLASRAAVTGPRGTFVTEMVTLADGTARFVQVYPPDDPKKRVRVELVVAQGNHAFQRGADGKFIAAEPGTAAFVRGHDAVRLALARGSKPATISQAAPPEMGGGTVSIELSDYRRVIDFEIPFTVVFVHSAAPNDRFVYRYTSVLPFRVAPGSPSPGGVTDAALLFDRLGDLGELAAMHERVMAAHRASDATMLTADAAERATVSGRGRLSEVKRDEQLAHMREYLGSIRFSRYADTTVPVIALSDDGSLAWLGCEMDAAGLRTVDGKSEPIAYGFSWVEQYARGEADTQGKRPWRAIGNASNQRP